MAGFRCLKCGKTTEKIEDRVRCPYCGYRIFSKKKPHVIKRVTAK